jgi:hypothetical protein
MKLIMILVINTRILVINLVTKTPVVNTGKKCCFVRPSEEVTVTCTGYEDDHVTVTNTGCEAVRDSEEVTVACTGGESRPPLRR